MQAETAETSETVPLRGISEATAAEILAFRDDRRWLPYHNPKDLAMSVAIEAGELQGRSQEGGPLSYLRDFAMRPMSPPTIIRKMKGPARSSRPSAMAAKVMKKPIMMQAEPMKPSGTPRLRA